MEKVLVVYASQNTAQSFRLAQDLIYRLFTAQHTLSELLDVHSLRKEHFLSPNTTLAFIISTRGLGNFPDGAESFLQEIGSQLSANGQQLKATFTCFGLGNSKYGRHFNKGATQLIQIMRYLGVTPSARFGFGDESHSLSHFSEFDEWCKDFLLHLSAKRASKLNQTDYQADSDLISNAVPKFLSANTLANTFARSVLTDRTVSPCDTFTKAKVVNGSRRCAKSGVTHLQLQSINFASFEVGDTLRIKPMTDSKLVNRLCKALFLKETSRIGCCGQPCRGECGILFCGFELGEVLRRFLDVTSVPSRAFLAALGHEVFPFGEIHHQKLTSFIDPDNVTEYMEYIIEENRSVADVLVDFALGLKSSETEEKKIIRFLLRYLQPIRLREYVIANDPFWYSYVQHQIHWRRLGLAAEHSVLVKQFRSRTGGTRVPSAQYSSDRFTGLVDLFIVPTVWTTRTKRRIKGSASTYLQNLKAKDVVYAELKKCTAHIRTFLSQMSDASHLSMWICDGLGSKTLLRAAYQKFLIDSGAFVRPTGTLEISLPPAIQPSRRNIVYLLYHSSAKTVNRVVAGDEVEAFTKLSALEDIPEQMAASGSRRVRVCIVGVSHPMGVDVDNFFHRNFKAKDLTSIAPLVWY